MVFRLFRSCDYHSSLGNRGKPCMILLSLARELMFPFRWLLESVERTVSTHSLPLIWICGVSLRDQDATEVPIRWLKCGSKSHYLCQQWDFTAFCDMHIWGTDPMQRFSVWLFRLLFLILLYHRDIDWSLCWLNWMPLWVTISSPVLSYCGTNTFLLSSRIAVVHGQGVLWL